MRNNKSRWIPAVPISRARLLAALHQAANEHRVSPEEVPALWDWIVDDPNRKTREARDCMWDWVVCEDTLSKPRRQSPSCKAGQSDLN